MTAPARLCVDKLLHDMDAARAQAMPRMIAPASVSQPDLSQPRRPLRAMVDEQVAADPDRLPWPDLWWDHTDSGDAALCRRLWASALLTLIRDIFDDRARLADMKRGGGNVRGDMSWIGTADFRVMCALAGFDPQAMADRLRTADPDMIARICKEGPRGPASGPEKGSAA